MIRYKSQPSQAKYERYPAISSFLVSLIKALKTANLKENVPAPKPNVLIDVFCLQSRFYGQIPVFHVLPVTARLVLRANPVFPRFARNRPSCFTRKSRFSTFCP